MAKRVDKDEKKRQIALSAAEIFVQKSINKTTVDDIAKAAGVGKGTIYLYFLNKYEVIVEIWRFFMEIHFGYIENKNSSKESNREKILHYHDFRSFIPSEMMETLFKLYQEYLGVILQNPQKELTELKIECRIKDIEYIQSYLEEGKRHGEFKESIDSQIVAELFASLPESIALETRIENRTLEHAEARLALATQELLKLIEKEN